MSRIYGLVVTVTILAFVLVPMRENWREEPKDNFPLSYYPMFSQAHRDVQSFTYIIGLTTTGERRRIRYGYAGSGGMNQVRKQIRRIARRGRRSAANLCNRVARRVAARNESELADVRVIQVVTGWYRPVEYFSSDHRDPIRERLHAACAVPRDTSR